MKQLHKKFTDYQIKELITRYLKKKIARKYIQEILGIKKTRFFALVKRLKTDPENFSISYSRKTPTRKISKDIEKNIVKELKIEKDLIKAKEVPIKYYNYSYIKDLLEQKYNQRVSLPTIIDRAKRNNFYFLRPKRKAHEKEVITNYPGELIYSLYLPTSIFRSLSVSHQRFHSLFRMVSFIFRRDNAPCLHQHNSSPSF